MRSLRNLVLGGMAIGASLALVAPAQSAEYFTYSTSTYSFAFGGNDSNNSAGNSINFTSTNKVNNVALTVKATAFNATKVGSTYSFPTAAQEQWSGGLGVTSTVGDNPDKSGCGVGDCNSHEIDNQGNKANSTSIDMVRLDFSKPVVLAGIGQTVYPSLNPGQTAYAYDADFSIGRGILKTDKSGFTAATDVVAGMAGVTNLTTNLFTYSQNVTSCTASNNNPCSQSKSIYTSAQAPYTTASTTWYVAASVLTNYTYSDNKTDGFKLASLNAYFINKTSHQSAVPEPSTWMTMIVGFGIAGTALRRARREKAALAA